VTRVVQAAGGVVVRQGSGGIEVLLVHRPEYDDWTFPKGKLEAGESLEECALREVEEETGLRCLLGRELASTEYADGKGRPKIVRYWLMHAEHCDLRFDNEVDDAHWLSPEEAVGRLSYERDCDVLHDAVDGGGDA
jgi:8-oxo-dGTP diphosphatase